MARALWLPDVLRDAGLPIKVYSGWETRGSSAFDPHGFIDHHTAGPAIGDYPTASIIIGGRADVPGPLSQIGTGRLRYKATDFSLVHIFASGKANHAGLGQWDARKVGGDRFLDHSFEVIGCENEHVGRRGVPWPVWQLNTRRVAAAAILDHLDVPTGNYCGHKEWAQPPESTPNRKPDPIDLDMYAERRIIDQIRRGTMAHELKDHEATVLADWAKHTWPEYVRRSGTGADTFGRIVQRQDLSYSMAHLYSALDALDRRVSALEMAIDRVGSEGGVSEARVRQIVNAAFAEVGKVRV